jgi:predicted RNase H-like HicB family nuclease
MTDPWRDPRSGRPLVYRVVPDADGFVAHCLAPDVASDGDTEAEALANLREALALYFDDTVGPELTAERA